MTDVAYPFAIDPRGRTALAQSVAGVATRRY
jgi:hypothetical protein